MRADNPDLYGDRFEPEDEEVPKEFKFMKPLDPDMDADPAPLLLGENSTRVLEILCTFLCIAVFSTILAIYLFYLNGQALTDPCAWFPKDTPMCRLSPPPAAAPPPPPPA